MKLGVTTPAEFTTFAKRRPSTIGPFNTTNTSGVGATSPATER